MGHDVTVFEALHELGGVLAYGIPEFRLPKEIVRSEISGLADQGVVFETDVLIGSGTTLADLMGEEGFDAVFVGTGAGLPRFPGIEGEDLIGYQQLLAQGLVRPGQLEVWVMDVDGKNQRQVTELGCASFAPFFHPSGEKILFSTNYPDPRGREFDLWLVNVDGSGLDRVTWSEGFDGFPMFSPDGKRLVFASNRHNSVPGETNIFVTDWRE